MMIKQYTPIASRSFGKVEELERRLLVFSQTNDAKNETIVIDYEIVLIAPTGNVISIINTGRYTRFNGEKNKKFDELRQSQLGQGISMLIQSDIDAIQGFDTIADDLSQKEPEPEQ